MAKKNWRETYPNSEIWRHKDSGGNIWLLFKGMGGLSRHWFLAKSGFGKRYEYKKTNQKNPPFDWAEKTIAL